MMSLDIFIPTFHECGCMMSTQEKAQGKLSDCMFEVMHVVANLPKSCDLTCENTCRLMDGNIRILAWVSYDMEVTF